MTLPSIATHTSVVNVLSWIECAQWMGLGYHSETTQTTTISITTTTISTTTTTTKTIMTLPVAAYDQPLSSSSSWLETSLQTCKETLTLNVDIDNNNNNFLQILQRTTTTTTRTIIRKDKWASKLSGQVKVDLWRSAATQTNSCWTLRQIHSVHFFIRLQTSGYKNCEKQILEEWCTQNLICYSKVQKLTFQKPNNKLVL